MKIIFSCICGQLLATNSVISGFKVSCPKCQIRITVPFENKAISEIIEIDFRDVIDPRGNDRIAKTTTFGEKSPKDIPSLQGGHSWEHISDREIP